MTLPLLRKVHWIDWIAVVLSPLWAYILVELLRTANCFNINIYGGWQFEEIYCSQEVLKRLNVVHAEYWHFPTLEAWMTFTISFFILGSGFALRLNWMRERNSTYKLPFLVVLVFIAAVAHCLLSLVTTPRRISDPFFELNALSSFLVCILIAIRGYCGSLQWRELTRLVAPILGAYILGLAAGALLYIILLNLNLLPAIVYC